MKKLTIFIFIIIGFNGKAALNESACASIIVNELKSVNSGIDQAVITPFWIAVCKGLIAHIRTNALVTTAGTAAVTGGSSSGAHPTTSTGTIQ